MAGQSEELKTISHWGEPEQADRTLQDTYLLSRIAAYEVLRGQCENEIRQLRSKLARSSARADSDIACVDYTGTVRHWSENT